MYLLKLWFGRKLLNKFLLARFRCPDFQDVARELCRWRNPGQTIFSSQSLRLKSMALRSLLCLIMMWEHNACSSLSNILDVSDKITSDLVSKLEDQALTFPDVDYTLEVRYDIFYGRQLRYIPVVDCWAVEFYICLVILSQIDSFLLHEPILVIATRNHVNVHLAGGILHPVGAEQLPGFLKTTKGFGNRDSSHKFYTSNYTYSHALIALNVGLRKVIFRVIVENKCNAGQHPRDILDALSDMLFQLVTMLNPSLLQEHNVLVY
ncbi:hypothetical protein L6452_17988 [Arctium lappa]|uniref:Uncharacterized protein n=1 Tax=Arctium lappa TaxID=4217 RepID=A0ACB9C4S7_ARCLA|nr:hypothetical protein L6452_17988 [Arctium lappa]